MRRTLCLTLLALLCAIPARAGQLSHRIDVIIKNSRCLRPATTAVSLIELATGRSVYALNDDKPLKPASVMKLITTAAALKTLGPGFRFETRIFESGVRGGPDKSVIEGDLIIKGGGDPKLTAEVVWLIAGEVRRLGVRKVTGRLILDDSFFDGMGKAPAWAANRSTRAYDAKLGALSVNFNNIAIHTTPGQQIGDRVIASLEPAVPLFDLHNRATTRARRKRLSYRLITKDGGRMQLAVSGAMRPGDTPKIRYLPVPDPTLFAGALFRRLLHKEGVVIVGGTIKGVTPPNARELLVHRSEPLVDIVRQLNRFSNNFMAEQTLKTIGAVALGAPGTHAKGFAMVRKFLAGNGIAIRTDNLVLADGSGLSRANRITPRTLTRLFVKMNHQFDLWPDFLSSFAIMGLEGSMDKRLKNSPALGLVRAKTGSLNRVSNLAGIMPDRTGRLYAFAIMLNDNSCGHDGADHIEDRIITAIFQEGGK